MVQDKFQQQPQMSLIGQNSFSAFQNLPYSLYENQSTHSYSINGFHQNDLKTNPPYSQFHSFSSSPPNGTDSVVSTYSGHLPQDTVFSSLSRYRSQTTPRPLSERPNGPRTGIPLYSFSYSQVNTPTIPQNIPRIWMNAQSPRENDPSLGFQDQNSNSLENKFQSMTLETRRVSPPQSSNAITPFNYTRFAPSWLTGYSQDMTLVSSSAPGRYSQNWKTTQIEDSTPSQSFFSADQFEETRNQVSSNNQHPYHIHQLNGSSTTNHLANGHHNIHFNSEHNHKSSGSGGSGDELSEYSSKKTEHAESPTTKNKYKTFFREFKLKEREGFEVALEFATQNLEILPENIHWKVYLEMADLAKRENRIKEARKFYKQVNSIQPTAPQGWLEYAKMEEESGDLDRCGKILSQGLSFCPLNESLMVKGLKHHERMGDIKSARGLLSRLRFVTVERSWRTLLEGALLEARAGNIGIARKVFKYLIHSVPWYGPIYQEAYRFEERCENYDRAIQIVEKGLSENPRYGPLWFSALRLYEKISNGDLTQTRETVQRAIKSISKELTWKVYFEAAQIEERAGNSQRGHDYYVQSVMACQENLLWKVWLGGARSELNQDNISVARKLLDRSLESVPTKMKATVLLEYSRLEEFAGNFKEARCILDKAKLETKHEWKVFLESVLLELRSNNFDGAIQEAQEALEIHTGTGRLWAVIIQLREREGTEEQIRVFKEALHEVPKSGEVWCEGARIHLKSNELETARRFLDFAIQFTPQYGDSFVEYLRLELLENGPNFDTSHLERLCVNADPNYGTLWLHCKKHPLDSARQVLRVARELLCQELFPTNNNSSSSSSNPSIRLSSNTINSKYQHNNININNNNNNRENKRRGPSVLSLNDLYTHLDQLTPSERRKAIFGSDQLKP